MKTQVFYKKKITFWKEMHILFRNATDQPHIHGQSQTHPIVWSGARCCATSRCCGWGDWTCGTRSHLTCPRFPHRPAWGDLRLSPPPAPPVSGTGSSYPPPLPALASWRETACSRVPAVGNRRRKWIKNLTRIGQLIKMKRLLQIEMFDLIN